MRKHIAFAAFLVGFLCLAYAATVSPTGWSEQPAERVAVPQQHGPTARESKSAAVDNGAAHDKVVAGAPPAATAPSVARAEQKSRHGSGSHGSRSSHLPHGIPDFLALDGGPTLASVRDGRWDDPHTWDQGRTPRDGDRILIRNAVECRGDPGNYYPVIANRGRLVWSCPLRLRTYVEYPGATTLGEPGMQAVIAGPPPDTSLDPEQYGAGLLLLGTHHIEGRAKTPFARLIEPAGPGQETIRTGPADGWRVGDTVVVTDSRQPPVEYGAWHCELRTIAEVTVDGYRLDRPLEFDHEQARDHNGNPAPGNLPVVQNLSRNVVVRSEDPATLRGHVLIAHRADSVVRYVEFRDMGRTTNEPLDNTTFDADGNVTHVGTNQIARYAAHYHHCFGPERTDRPYQYEFVGNAVWDHPREPRPIKGGIIIHATHFGLTKDNVVFNKHGFGIWTEDGTERGNVFDGNCVAMIRGINGARKDDTGRFGDAFWFRGCVDTVVTNNVACCAAFGYQFFSKELGNDRSRWPRLPEHRGQHPRDYAPVRTNHRSWKRFENNEAYACSRHNDVWNVGARTKRGGGYTSTAAELNVMRGVNAWHTALPFSAYYHHDLRVVGGHLLGDARMIQGKDKYESAAVVFGGSRTSRLHLEGLTIEGYRTGVYHRGRGAAEEFTMKDCRVYSSVGIFAQPWMQQQAGVTSTLENVVFGRPRAPVGEYAEIELDAGTNGGTAGSLRTAPFVFRVIDHNGVAGDNFRVYFDPEQRSDYTIPLAGANERQQKKLGVWGVAGLTNAEAWQRNGTAMYRAIAPCRDHRAGIRGFVCPE